MSTHYDIIIIGSGAGGGTLFHALAPTGKRILLLERGGYVPREKDNWSTKVVNLEGKYQTAEVWHDRGGVDYSCGAVWLQLLAAALVLSTASSGALSLAAGVSVESTMTSAFPASSVDVRSRSSTASNRGSSFAARS